MRHYTQVSYIVDDSGSFLKELSKKIEEFQVEDYGVEIQFQTTKKTCEALVLQYKEV